MRDEQVRRYSRHILVPDIGGLGQTALLVGAARMELRESEPDAELIGAMFLAAGGVGSVVMVGATDAQVEQVAARGPDTTVVPSEGAAPAGVEVMLPPKPPWWPGAPGDTLALAYWRGAIAATRWMAGVANE